MAYYIDLEKISLERYAKQLESAYLPPSRMILKEKPSERLAYFKSKGIENIKQLVQLLRKKDQFAELNEAGCFPDSYLTILLRELNSIQPKPNKFADFPGISPAVVDKLSKTGIDNTLKLYERVVSKAERLKLAELTGISLPEILELTQLADLSRIKWVGATFARMLYDVGIDSAEKVSKADPVELHSAINRVNKEKSIYKGQIGLNDMVILVNAAREIPLEIEY